MVQAPEITVSSLRLSTKWDDRGQFVESPNIKEVAEVGVAVVATAATAGMGAPLMAAMTAAAINLSDDLLFTALDLAYTDKDQNQVIGDFAKKAVVTMGTAAIGGAFGGTGIPEGVKPADATFWQKGITQALAGDNVFKQVGVGFVQQATTNSFSSAVNAINYESGAWGFDANAFQEGVIGEQALAGYLSSGAGTLTKGLLAGNLNGFSQFHKSQVNAVAGFGGNLASMGVDYAMTGNVTMNVLNTSDFGAGFSSGLFAISLGDDGFSGKLSTAGYNMGYSRLASVAQGMNTFGMQQRIRAYDASGKVDYADEYEGVKSAGTALRANFSFGDEAAQKRLDNLLKGAAGLRVGYLNAGKGHTGVDGAKTIMDLATLGQKGDLDSQLNAAIVLQHEAHRDGLHNGVDGQNRETAMSVYSHMAMANRMASEFGDEFLDAANKAEVAKFREAGGDFNKIAGYALANYDSSSDYWKMTSDGNVVWDGNHELYDENGKLLDPNYGGSRDPRASLAHHLGVSKEAAELLMVQSGWGYSDGTYLADGVDVKNNQAQALEGSPELKARYEVQMKYVDNVFSEYGGDMEAAMRAAEANIENGIQEFIRNGSGDMSKLQAQREMLSGMKDFASTWNTAMYGEEIPGLGKVGGYWDQDRYSQADIARAEDALDYIYQNFSYDDSNPMYELIGDGKDIDFINGPTVVTTTSHYDSGKLHGWLRGGDLGLSIDLAPDPLLVSPTASLEYFTFVKSTMLFGTGDGSSWSRGNSSFNSEYGTYGSGYGYRSYLQVGNLEMLSAHQYPYSDQSRQMELLYSTGSNAGLYRMDFPAGYNYGVMGNTGNSTNNHMHAELWRR